MDDFKEAMAMRTDALINHALEFDQMTRDLIASAIEAGFNPEEAAALILGEVE